MSRRVTLARWGAALALALAGTAAAAQSAAAPAPSPEAMVRLKPPPSPEVAWRGQLPTEGTGVRSGGMVYPGGAGVIGLLVGVFTHAAIEGGVQSAARKREQDEADKVLEPYRGALQGWNSQALWQATLALDTGVKPAEPGDAAAAASGTRALLALPVFTMAADESALVLDVAIKLDAPAGAPASAAPAETTVRVVSSPLPEGEARALWSADDAARLKRTAAAMLAHALRLAVRHEAVLDDTAVPPRTLRYLQGAQERTERGQPLEQGCRRLVMRTLRGWLKSVPQRTAEGAPACSDLTAF